MSTVAIIPIAVTASLALTVLSVGLQATPADAVWLFRHPFLVFRSILSMNVAMPFAALYTAIALDLHPAVKLALVALALSPVTPYWPNTTVSPNGEASHSTALQAMASLLSILLVPFSVYMLSAVLETPVHMSPRTAAALIAKGVLLPLGLGVVVRRVAPLLSIRFAKPIALVGTGVLCIAAIPMLISARTGVGALLGNENIFAILFIAIAGLCVGHVLGGPVMEDRSALALCTAARHPAVALAIAHATFPGNALVPATLLLELSVAAVVTQLYVLGIRRFAQRRGPANDMDATANYSGKARPMRIL
jgi:bile acid:Na+ symporter, BASS family